MKRKFIIKQYITVLFQAQLLYLRFTMTLNLLYIQHFNLTLSYSKGSRRYEL